MLPDPEGAAVGVCVPALGVGAAGLGAGDGALLFLAGALVGAFVLGPLEEGAGPDGLLVALDVGAGALGADGFGAGVAGRDAGLGIDEKTSHTKFWTLLGAPSVQQYATATVFLSSAGPSLTRRATENQGTFSRH